MRRPENREWQLILARAYRMLAEAETESAARVNQPERSRTSILVGSPTAAPTSRAGDPARGSSGQAPRAV
jgi:hypothetical protein